jgi:hypothetical protein
MDYTMKAIAVTIGIILSSSVGAVEIASCSNPSGTVYFPELGLINKKDSGWQSDKITGGITKLSKLGNTDFDIIYVDSTKRITSYKESGATVLLLSQGKNNISILVVYPGVLAEIYSFIKNNSGKLEYTHVASRGGDTLIPKSSIMRGDCQALNFDLL